MPEGKSSSGGKGGRKHGRGRRSPAAMRYLAARRWMDNAASRLARFIRRHPTWKPDEQNPPIDDGKLSAARRINRALEMTRPKGRKSEDANA